MGYVCGLDKPKRSDFAILDSISDSSPDRFADPSPHKPRHVRIPACREDLSTRREAALIVDDLIQRG
jgi:hypothetical protein